MLGGGGVKRVAATAGSALFFALAPGTVAGLLPWALTGWRVGTALPWPGLHVYSARC